MAFAMVDINDPSFYISLLLFKPVVESIAVGLELLPCPAWLIVKRAQQQERTVGVLVFFIITASEILAEDGCQKTSQYRIVLLASITSEVDQSPYRVLVRGRGEFGDFFSPTGCLVETLDEAFKVVVGNGNALLFQ